MEELAYLGQETQGTYILQEHQSVLFINVD